MLRSLLLAVLALISATPATAQQTDTLRSTVLSASGAPTGIHKEWTAADGSRHFYLAFNDRGRGPELRERVTLGADGFPRSIEITGNDYFKAPVAERFLLERAGSGWKASWKSTAESTSVTRDTPAYYAPLQDASVNLLELLLLAAPDKRVALFPQGEARLERIRDLTVRSDRGQAAVTLYATHGLGLTPYLWWADERGRFFAAGGSWFMFIREGYETVRPALLSAQASYASARGATLARTLTRRPTRPVVFRNANLFDAETGRLRPRTTVVVSGNRVTAVGADGSVSLPDGADVVDVAGRTLMPGMWDMHVHASDDDGLLHLAAGVTMVRDLANDVDETIRRKQRFDDGTLIGPRMILAGFIDGPGPFAGPTKALVATKDSARLWLDRYAQLGYEQIKLYSSLDTALVPFIIAEAHKRGLRISGHVPNGMTAEEFVRAGADEVQHANMLFLNFWRDSVKDTRTPERFTAPGERAALLDLRSGRVARFIGLLRERGTVIDPTLVAFEGMLTARPGVVDPSYAAIADRVPPNVRRGFLTGGLPVADSLDQRYQDSFAAFGWMVKAMHDAGVPIVAGTDAFAGFAYHRELELYAAAGIPTSDILRIATINAARIMKRDKELGSIAPGKLADLIIVDGNPVERIADIRRVSYVMKDGKVYDPRALLQTIGVRGAAAAR
jgi:imidazolonepropionase-like amidohydrolase